MKPMGAFSLRLWKWRGTHWTLRRWWQRVRMVFGAPLLAIKARVIDGLVRAPTYDCQSCGACCAWPKDFQPLLENSYISQLPEDIENTPARLWKKNEAGRNFVIFQGGRCVALEGTVGCRVSCSVYAQRPKECQTARVGGDICTYAREIAGMGLDPFAWERSRAIALSEACACDPGFSEKMTGGEVEVKRLLRLGAMAEVEVDALKRAVGHLPFGWRVQRHEGKRSPFWRDAWRALKKLLQGAVA